MADQVYSSPSQHGRLRRDIAVYMSQSPAFFGAIAQAENSDLQSVSTAQTVISCVEINYCDCATACTRFGLAEESRIFLSPCST